MKNKLVAICSLGMMFCFVSMYFSYGFFNELQDSDLFLIPLLSAFSSLAGTCLVILIYDVLLKKDKDSEAFENIENCIQKAVERSMNAKMFGIHQINDRFHNQRFIDAISRSKNIYILQTYAPNIADLESAITEFVKNGGQLKIALLNTKSGFVDIRVSETSDLHPTRQAFEAKIEGNVLNLTRSANKKKNGGMVCFEALRNLPGSDISW